MVDHIETIIPKLIEIGVDILNPIQPECIDPVMLKKKYEKNIVLDGTIGTQTDPAGLTRCAQSGTDSAICRFEGTYEPFYCSCQPHPRPDINGHVYSASRTISLPAGP